MRSNKSMTVTKKGLTTISRELLNKRKFQKNLISRVGLPVVTEDDIVNSIDNDNYFKYSNLSFQKNSKISIKVKGLYVKPDIDEPETLWSLNGVNKDQLALVMFPNKISLMLGAKEVGTLAENTFKSSSAIDIKLTLNSDNFEITYIYNSKYNIISGKLYSKLDFNGYSEVRVGVSKVLPYWRGDIDLSNFIIYENDNLLYAPSTEAAFNFTKVLISNGNIPLEDNSTPILNNIYAFNLSEINRTNNSILLLARIDSDVYLDIEEVGLYSVTDEGPMLFSKVSGLSIRKNRNLGYGLIFNVRLDLGVVNTVAMPEILVYQKDTINQKDFLTTKRVHTYITIDMERIIDMNATNLGYERAQEVSNNYNKFRTWSINNKSVQNYLILNDKVKTKEVRKFNKDKLKKVGDVKIFEDGTSFNYSNNNYVKVENIFPNSSSLKYQVAFKMPDYSKEEQTIFSIYGDTNETPFLIKVNPRDNGCYIKASKEERIEVLNKAVSVRTICARNLSNDKIHPVNSNKYYAWRNIKNSNFFNPHVSLLGKVKHINGILSDFSDKNYAQTPSKLNFTKSFSLEFSFTKSSVKPTGSETIFSADKNFCISVELNSDNRLVYNLGDGTSWFTTPETSLGKTFLHLDKAYDIKIIYDGTSYKSLVSLNGIDEYTTDWTLTSTKKVPESTLIIGQKYDHTQAWKGIINILETSFTLESILNWTGCLASPIVLTTDKKPTSSSALFDSEMYPFADSEVTSYLGGTLFEEKLFNVERYAKYVVSFEYTNEEYIAKVSVNEKQPKIIYSKKTSERMNTGKEAFFGISWNGEDSSNPFNGEIFLEEADIIVGDLDFSPSDKKVQEKELKDYYSIALYPYSLYKVVNLKDPESTEIEFFEGALTGKRDNIDFSSKNGFSLCTKVFLRDGANKVILAKINPDSEDRYFVLQYIDNMLSFKLYEKEGVISLSKQYDLTTFRQVTEFPFTLTVTYNGDPFNSEYKMYKNKTLLDEYKGPSSGFFEAENYILTNYLNFQEPNEVSSVLDIVSFEGELNENELAMVNNLLDTNF